MFNQKAIFCWLFFSSVLHFVYSAQLPVDTASIIQRLDSSKQFISTAPHLARQLMEENIEHATALDYKQGLALSWMNLGVINYYEGNLLQSMACYTKADSLFSLLSDSNRLAILYSNRGVLYTVSDELDRALDDYLRAIDVNTTLGNTQRLATNYINVGGIHFKEKNYAAALNYYRQALTICRTTNDSIGIATNLGNIGGVLLYQTLYDSASQHFDSAQLIYHRLNNQRGLLSIYNHFGVLNEKQGQYKKARRYFEKSLELARSLNAQRSVSMAMGNIAATHFKEQNFSQAVAWLQNEIELNKSLSDSVVLKRTYRSLADAYLALNMHKEANEALLAYDQLNELLSGKERNHLLKNISFKHALYTKEKEVRLLSQQNAIQQLQLEQERFYLYGTLLLVVLVAGLVYAFMRLRQQQIQQQNMNLQQQVWRNQVDPHFIFNVFNSIHSYFINKDYETGKTYLRKFAQLMRAFLEKSATTFSPLNEELEMMRRYLEVEQLRLGGNMAFDIEVDKSLQTSALLIPTFIAQPFLENAVWHGLADIEESGEVLVKLNRLDDSLILIIADNGIGIERSKALKSSTAKLHRSKGIAITTARLQQLNKTKKATFKLEIKARSSLSDKQPGTEVRLTLPLLKREC
jgi:tetratricopeptide (TPR) repeat protein